jgi:hypothetical protein
MNDTDILNLILIIALISVCFLCYFFRGKIKSFGKIILHPIIQQYFIIKSSNKKNEYCIFLYWLKFLQFCIWFIFMLSGIVILFWMIFKNPVLPDFFKNVTITTSLKIINPPSSIQSYAGDFSSFILLIGALIGAFAGYCYFYNYIKSIGWKINKLTSEYGNWSSAFMYLFFLCVLIAVVFIGGASEKYFGALDSNKFLELSILSSFLIIAILNMIFFRKIYPKKSLTYERSQFLISFLKQEEFDNYFNSISVIIFFITLEIAVFGHIFGFNPLSIICVDVFLLFTLWVLGILNQHPQNLSTIRLKSGNSINQVFLLDIEDNFIHYLTKDDQTETVTTSSIFKIEKDQESSLFKSDKNIKNHKKPDNGMCFYFSKISEGTTIIACIISIFIGIVFNLIVAVFQFLQFKEIFYQAIEVIFFLFLFVIAFLSIIILSVYFEIKKSSEII